MVCVSLALRGVFPMKITAWQKTGYQEIIRKLRIGTRRFKYRDHTRGVIKNRESTDPGSLWRQGLCFTVFTDPPSTVEF